MARRDYVFDYEAEPAAERPTGYGDTAFGHTTGFGHTSHLGSSFDPWNLTSSATAPAPWSVSAHSTFEEPSRAIDRVQQQRRHRHLRARLAVLAALLAAVAAAAVVLLRPWSA